LQVGHEQLIEVVICNDNFIIFHAGVSGTSIVYPLDIIKTQLQTCPELRCLNAFSATITAASRIVSKSGMLGLYRGFQVCAVGIAPEKALKLAVNDFGRDYFASDGNVIKVHEEIIAGSFAGLVQLSVTVPYELIKVRLQLQVNSPKHLQHSAMNIVKSIGFTGLYRGFTATLFRDVPFCFLFFVSSLSLFFFNSSIL
jgi:solute carrier family 25 (mitochondrial aspartate/glutamate transporter), member 12/13